MNDREKVHASPMITKLLPPRQRPQIYLNTRRATTLQPSGQRPRPIDTAIPPALKGGTKPFRMLLLVLIFNFLRVAPMLTGGVLIQASSFGGAREPALPAITVYVLPALYPPLQVRLGQGLFPPLS